MEFDELAGDPVLGPLVKKISTLEGKLTETRALAKDHGDRLQRHENTWIASSYQTQLSNIAAHHERRFGKRFDRDNFLQYAVGHGVTDLETAYRSWSLDAEVEKARKDAEERGAARRRRETGAGRSLFDAPRIRPPHLGNVESLDQLTDDQVFADPDIQAALRGEE
jgi:hypothetical protein